MKSSLCSVSLETTVRCRIAGCAALRAGPDAIAQWRKEPVVVGPEKLAPSFLKHAEDQTVLAWTTVRTVLEQQGWQGRSFGAWGVVAAPNLFGRVSIAQAIQRYQQEGAWGVSPHLIPHQSLHGMSGTISQALKIYGPNFGIGGGPNAGPDAFLIAGAMMMDRQLPGLWLVLTGYDSEWIPSADGRHAPAPMCQAVALALSPDEPAGSGLHLSFGQARSGAAGDHGLALLPEFQLGLLAEELSVETGLPGGKWRLGDTHWLELESILAEPEERP